MADGRTMFQPTGEPMTVLRSTRDQTRAFYDRLSHAYDLIADSSEHAIRDLGIQALCVSNAQRVLEIGFGTGHGLVGLARPVGSSGHVYGVEISTGMIGVARGRIESANLRNITVTAADARALCFETEAFDAVFMSFTLELFDPDIQSVLGEVKRVLRGNGRLGVVAMSKSGDAGAMVDLYQWMHSHWPHVVDCQPIDAPGVLRLAGFETQVVHAETIWGLPVLAVVGLKRPDFSPAG